MPSERLAPDAILAQSGFTAGTVTDIDEDPDTPDANWLNVAGASNVSTSVRVSFPSPSDSLSNGAGLQEFRVQVRKTSQSTNPTCVVELYENGSLVSTVVSSTTISATDPGSVLSGTWDSTGRTASLIECNVVGTVGGGSPGNRASVEVGAIEWNATIGSSATNANAGNASGTVASNAGTWAAQPIGHNC